MKTNPKTRSPVFRSHHHLKQQPREEPKTTTATTPVFYPHAVDSTILRPPPVRRFARRRGAHCLPGVLAVPRRIIAAQSSLLQHPSLSSCRLCQSLTIHHLYAHFVHVPTPCSYPPALDIVRDDGRYDQAHDIVAVVARQQKQR